jgi:N-acetylmuramoyl-L-alanine amidase
MKQHNFRSKSIFLLLSFVLMFVMAIPLASAATTQLQVTPVSLNNPFGISADGNRVLLFTNGGNGSIGIYDVPSRTPVLSLTPSATFPKIAPNGNYVVYTNGNNVYMAKPGDVAGTIIYTGSMPLVSSISPDSNKILINNNNAVPRTGFIYTVSPSSLVQVSLPMVSGDTMSQASFSADNQNLIIDVQNSGVGTHKIYNYNMTSVTGVQITSFAWTGLPYMQTALAADNSLDLYPVVAGVLVHRKVSFTGVVTDTNLTVPNAPVSSFTGGTAIGDYVLLLHNSYNYSLYKISTGKIVYSYYTGNFVYSYLSAGFLYDGNNMINLAQFNGIDSLAPASAVSGVYITTAPGTSLWFKSALGATAYNIYKDGTLLSTWNYNTLGTNSSTDPILGTSLQVPVVSPYDGVNHTYVVVPTDGVVEFTAQQGTLSTVGKVLLGNQSVPKNSVVYFGGQYWKVFDDNTLALKGTLAGLQMGPLAAYNKYDTLQTGNLAIYLNSTFLNSFTTTEQGYVQSYRYTSLAYATNQLVNGAAGYSMNAKVGLPSVKSFVQDGFIPETSGFWLMDTVNNTTSLYTGGTPSGTNSTNPQPITPVVHLIPNVTIVGTGTMADPYVVSGTTVSSSAPTNFTSQVTSTTSAFLTWDAVSGASSYQLSRNGQIVYTGPNTNFSDTALAKNSTYSYSVMAQYAGTNSAAANLSLTTPDTLAAPTDLIATDNAISVGLNWTAVSGATSYQITRNGSVIGTVTSPMYTDSSAVLGTQYTYTLTATNAIATSQLVSVTLTHTGTGGTSTPTSGTPIPTGGTAGLTSMSINNGSIPATVSGTVYSVTVDSSINSVLVNFTTINPTDKVKFNGLDVFGGLTAATVGVGSNYYAITVLSADSTVQKTYTLSITRVGAQTTPPSTTPPTGGTTPPTGGTTPPSTTPPTGGTTPPTGSYPGYTIPTGWVDNPSAVSSTDNSMQDMTLEFDVDTTLAMRMKILTSSLLVSNVANPFSLVAAATRQTLTLDHPFSSNTLVYNGTVPSNAKTMYMTPIANSLLSKVSLDSASTVTQYTYGVILHDGLNPIVVTITSEAGVPKNYTFNITRTPAVVSSTPATGGVSAGGGGGYSGGGGGGGSSSSSGGSAASGSSPSVAPAGTLTSGNGVTATTTPTGTTVAVDSVQLQSILDSLKDLKQLVVDATSKQPQTSPVTVSLDQASLDALKKAGTGSVVVNNNFVTYVVNIGATTGPVSVITTPVALPTSDGAGHTPLGNGGMQLTTSGVGNAAITINLPTGTTGTTSQSTNVYLQNADGGLAIVPSHTDATGNKIVPSATDGTYVLGSYTPQISDVNTNWAQDQLTALAKKEIISGYPDGTFKPDDLVTRAEFSSMLVKALAEKTLTLKGVQPSFADVTKGDWFYGAVGVSWKLDLVKGLQDGSFAPNENITREQMASVINRSMLLVNGNEQVSDSEATQILSTYKDQDTISQWAKPELATAIKAGLFNGMSDSTLDPQNTGTRAQAAALIYRLMAQNGLLKKGR